MDIDPVHHSNPILIPSYLEPNLPADHPHISNLNAVNSQQNSPVPAPAPVVSISTATVRMNMNHSANNNTLQSILNDTALNAELNEMTQAIRDMSTENINLNHDSDVSSTHSLQSQALFPYQQEYQNSIATAATIAATNNTVQQHQQQQHQQQQQRHQHPGVSAASSASSAVRYRVNIHTPASGTDHERDADDEDEKSMSESEGMGPASPASNLLKLAASGNGAGINNVSMSPLAFNTFASYSSRKHGGGGGRGRGREREKGGVSGMSSSSTKLSQITRTSRRHGGGNDVGGHLGVGMGMGIGMHSLGTSSGGNDSSSGKLPRGRLVAVGGGGLGGVTGDASGLYQDVTNSKAVLMALNCLQTKVRVRVWE